MSASRKALIRLAILAASLSFIVLLSAACGSGSFEPPRLATQTAAVGATATPQGTPLVSLVPTPTIDPNGSADQTTSPEPQAEPADILTVWINESPNASSEQFISAVDAFVDQTGIEVDLVMVAPKLLPELVRTAVLSDTLPDIIVHPFEYSAGWVDQGILDSKAATDALNRLDADTFDAAAIDLITLDETGAIPALPSDGWKQLIVYRTDWFSGKDLEIPDSYETLFAAAETIFEPDSVVSGIIVPTDSDLLATQQAFEFIAAANGCELIDAQGEITLLHPACLEALEYYRALINGFSPIGVQTEISALNAFLTGRTGIIFASPAVLPALAGYDDTFRPNCPECADPRFLAGNTGILTELTGSGAYSTTASFGEINSIGVTTVADRELADQFIDFWFNDAYAARIADAPERRVPFREGTVDSPNYFTELWKESPIGSENLVIADIFGEETAEKLSKSVATTDRWGFPERQGSVITTLHEELIL
ncbi:MAG: ABC transporter substrate-binding protein, partial [Candidatus Promineifilaceae bacterium]